MTAGKALISDAPREPENGRVRRFRARKLFFDWNASFW